MALTYSYISATDSYELTSGSGESGLVIIPETYTGPQGTLPITRIGIQAFVNNQSVTSLVLGSNITNIKYGAFSRCSNLQTVTLGQNVKTLGEILFISDAGVFENCNSLKEIVIPKSVTYMGVGTFAYCYNLRKVFFLGNYPDIDSFAFYNLTNVTLYRKKNFVTGWPNSFFGSLRIALWSDNVVKSGGSGKLITKNTKANVQIIAKTTGLPFPPIPRYDLEGIYEYIGQYNGKNRYRRRIEDDPGFRYYLTFSDNRWGLSLDLIPPSPQFNASAGNPGDTLYPWIPFWIYLTIIQL